MNTATRMLALALMLGFSCTVSGEDCHKYVVQWGDSVYTIQRKFNLLQDDLITALQACGQGTDLLRVGMEICLPGDGLPNCTNPAPPPKPKTAPGPPPAPNAAAKPATVAALAGRQEPSSSGLAAALAYPACYQLADSEVAMLKATCAAKLATNPSTCPSECTEYSSSIPTDCATALQSAGVSLVDLVGASTTSTPCSDFAAANTASSTDAQQLDSSGGSHTSVGAIIGGVVGGLAVVAAVVAGIVLVLRRQKRRAKVAATALPMTSNGSVNGASNGAASLLGARFATFPPTALPPSGYGGVLQTGAGTAVSPSSSQLLRPPSAPPPNSPPGSSSSGARFAGSAAGMDPLMQYINGTVAPSLASRAGNDLAAWELNFAEIQIEHPIGEGSWGRVYKAKWHETPVAVKVLLETGFAGAAGTGGSASTMGAAIMPANDPMLARLQQEAAIISALHHPNIVQFLGMTLTPATLVSEYCAWGSLMDVLRAGRSSPAIARELDWPRRMAMACDACLGMTYLHTRQPPIIHRDLKTPNLLVDASWKVKVSDFGLSKIMEDSSRSTSTTAMNPRWLPPEVLSGERATPAADVYAFAVVMWELMTWELPWGGESLWSIVGAVNQGRRPEIPAPASLPGEGSGAWPGLPRYVALMKRCWAQEPQARPTFQEVVAELREIEPSIQT